MHIMPPYTKQRGAILTSTYLMSLMAILTMTAFSVNTYLFLQKNARLEHALESIAVALNFSGDNLTNADYNNIIATYKTIFFIPSDRNHVDIKIIPSTSSPDEVVVSGSINIPFLMSAFIDDISSTKSITISRKIAAKKIRDKIEVAMVLDLSGSMSPHLDSLKKSARKFIKQLFSDRASDEHVYISLIPFTKSVKLNGARSSWFINNHTCSDRYRHSGNQVINHILDSPKIKPFSGPSSCNQPELVELSNNESELVSHINQFTAGGTTAIDIGMAWGWRTLSPSWRNVWSQAGTRPLKDRVKKVMIIFTDGTGFKNVSVFRQMCTKVRKITPRIEVFAIQFGPGAQALRACAQSSDHYYLANNVQALSSAFKEISDKVGFMVKLSGQ